MDIMELGAIGELVGGIAVIGSLVYVGLQVRQSNHQISENLSWTKRQALDSVIDRVITWGARVRDNPDIVDLYLRGADEYDAFSAVEKQRFHLTKMEILASMETILEHSKTDGIKSETANAARRWVSQELSGDGAKTWWNERGRRIFSDDFGAAVDALIRDPAGPFLGSTGE